GDDDEGFEELESSAVFEALRQVDRDTLLAELGVSDVDQDDGEDDEEVEVGDLDAPEDVRRAALRLGIQRLHPEQKRVLDEVLAGHDVLMVLPTGFGKSACYQIPSMILPKPVLVVSPLLALMRDQSEKLAALDVPCVRLDGTVRGRERAAAIARVAAGGSLLVLTTPESLFNEEVMGALQRSGASLVAVDEAHCISEWGYDFRPAYIQLGERIRLLGRPPVLALTATATPKVRDAIQRFLGMENTVVVSSSPHRSNLAFDVLRCGDGARLRALLRLAFRVRRPGIIYCSTTREVDEIYAILQRFGVPSHRYHGKMSAAERRKNQDGFMRRGRRTVMVATSAFGLGIDKPDIRYVLHFHAPGSLEQYVQEAGRAGRDGRRANCILLYAPEDRKIHEALLSKSRVRPEQLYKLGHALAAWAGEDKTPSVAALALSANLGTRTTGALLALLEEATLVRFDQDAVYVTVPADEIEEEARKLASQFETLRTQDARRLEAVADYADEARCRAGFLASYFGEEVEGPCGLCDRCRGGTERPDSFFEPLAPPRRALRRGAGGRARGGGPGRRGARPGGERFRFGGGEGERRRGRHRGRGPDQAGPVAGQRAEGEERRRGRRRGGRRGRGRRPEGFGGEVREADGRQPGAPASFTGEVIRPEPGDFAPGSRPGFARPNGGDPSGELGPGRRRRRRRRGRRRGRGPESVPRDPDAPTSPEPG
ncbi:MAG TPA: RecQ family ATP-dependent DNA helicase, partial [Myxococcota bacterium]|nr:RecQ family ATP-dependent DNA helicase [Myxococcota bacterium]